MRSGSLVKCYRFNILRSKHAYCRDKISIAQDSLQDKPEADDYLSFAFKLFSSALIIRECTACTSGSCSVLSGSRYSNL